MRRRAFISTVSSGGAAALVTEGCSSAVTYSKPPAPGHRKKDLPPDSTNRVTVATCQFAISADIERNCTAVTNQMRLAKMEGANVAHFSETSLGGYAGVDFDSFEGYDWTLLKRCTLRIMSLANELDIWVILGSNHRLTGDNKPHNSLYVIDNRGKILDRYDKMFCTGNREETSGDLKHYTPGSRFVLFDLAGVTCGLQICHDMRYPEMYREYKKLGAQLMFHSYYNGKRSFDDPDDPDKNIHKVITEPTMQTYAAVNSMWISTNNTATKESSWPSFFVRPDGVVTGRLKRNAEAILISTVDTGNSYYDASRAWRDRAMNGVFHSGTLVTDPRSDNRRSL